MARATYRSLPSYTLDALIEHVEPDLTHAPGRRHRATYDAYATAQILIAMAGEYETWGQLVAVAVPPRMPGNPEPDTQATLW
ncbi:hypothetical protein [Streptomyces sp. NBC_01506]|uniref:hypothetical protein n=1 Tax=Streptomyces sp. NBC_01506 TaxID=2903887 RepID=UPI0038695B79